MKKHAESHMDHGFTTAQWDFIFAKYVDKTAFFIAKYVDKTGFFIDTFELPEDLGTVTNELYGPSAGNPPVPESEVFYDKRGERVWKSRLVKRPKRPTRFVRVIAGPHEEKCAACGGDGLTPAYSLHDRAVGIDQGYPCKMCKGTKVTKHACILYTAYGVASIDMSAAPKEVGDLRKQLNAIDPETCSSADVARYEQLREQCGQASIFWATHALAAL